MWPTISRSALRSPLVVVLLSPAPARYCSLLYLPLPPTSRPSSTANRRLSLLHPRPWLLQTRARMASAATTSNDVSFSSSPDHVVGNWYSVPELRLRNHYFTVPLDYSADSDSSPKISVFAREVVAAGKEDHLLPYLLYLQGGPGFESPRPTEASGWISKACEGYRVVLLDQRGTGLSTPLTSTSLLQIKSSEDLAKYLKHFRADSIVKDAEFIRVRMVPDSGSWTVLGQVKRGIPPIGNGCTADVVYRECFQQIIRQNKKYYERFPQDIKSVHEIVNYLASREGCGVGLPSGGTLTPRGLQTLGLTGLGSGYGFERLHYMLETAWDPVIVPGAEKHLSYYFLNAFERWSTYDTNPLYAILHEPIYCQGAASRWSAHRIRAEYEDAFDAVKAAKEGRPVFFTGEMIFPWMFDEFAALKPFKKAAELLAEKEDWSPLYDASVLKNNKVPVAAAVYYEDMFVNFKLASETASQIAGIRPWITNEYMHSGLRDSGCHVFDHLMGMLNGKKLLF